PYYLSAYFHLLSKYNIYSLIIPSVNSAAFFASISAKIPPRTSPDNLSNTSIAVDLSRFSTIFAAFSGSIFLKELAVCFTSSTSSSSPSLSDRPPLLLSSWFVYFSCTSLISFQLSVSRCVASKPVCCFAVRLPHFSLVEGSCLLVPFGSSVRKVEMEGTL